MANPASFNLIFPGGVGPQPIPVPQNNTTQQQTQQGVNHEAHRTITTQQAIQDIMVDEDRIANMTAAMFNQFHINSGVQHVEIGKSAQAIVQETADNEGGNFQEENAPEANSSRRERPLNMWIAFRCYYAKMFPGIQQKDVSSHLTTLWREDPFKAKWGILAAAYTMIRASLGKQQCPLDQFLKIVCPDLGMIPEHEYMQKLNWLVEVGEDGGTVLRQSEPPNPEVIGQHGRQISVMETVWVAAGKGYLENKEAIDLGKLSTLKWLNFSKDMTVNPTGLATQIMGLPMHHPFMEVVSQNPHPWTGNLSQYFTRNDRTLDPHEMVGSHEHNTFDIGSPSSFAAFERRNGLDGPTVHMPDNPSLFYDIGNSF